MCKNCQGGRENEIELLHVLWLTLDCDCCWGGQVSNGCFCTSSVSTYRYARQTWRPSMDFGTVVLPDAVSNLRPRGVKCRFREPSKGTVTELWLFSKKVNKQKMKEKRQQQKSSFTGNRAALRTKSPFRPTISAPIMSEGQKNLLLIAVLMSNWQIQATIFCEFSFYRIKQWDKEKGGIKWGGGIPKGGLQQGAEHEVIVPAWTHYSSKKVEKAK